MDRILSVAAVVFVVWSLAVCLSADGSASAPVEKTSSQKEPKTPKASSIMKISVSANGNTTVFELNNSPAARSLYDQLPLNIEVENYSDNEKIFYPPKKLDTTGTPQANAHRAGTLAYYAPWGDVVMFYGSFGSASGLYTLGHAVSGGRHIREMSGTARIEKWPGS